MIDNTLYKVVRDELLAQLSRYGQPTWRVKQNYQPTQQGDTGIGTIYFHKITDTRYGWLQRADAWDMTEEEMRHIESQQIETTLQVSGVLLETADNTSGMLTGDMVKLAAQAFQSDTMMQAMRARGLGVLRVRDVRTIQVVNDQGNFEPSPSFDVVLTHRDTYEEIIAIVNTREINIHAV